MHSLYEGTFLQAELLSLSCCRDTNRVVEEVVVKSIQSFQIPFQRPLLYSFSLFARLRQD